MSLTQRRRRRNRESPSEETLARKYTEPCFFRSYLCDGPMDLAHLIPAQRLRMHGDPVWDDRVLVVMCRAHHHRFDNGFIRLDRDELPHCVHEYASDYDLTWSIDLDYGPPQGKEKEEIPSPSRSPREEAA